MTNDLIKQKWSKGKRNTLVFYHRKSKWKFEKFNKKFPLHNYFAPMIGDKKEVLIADLGAGLISTTGNTWPTAKIKLYPSDILADKFNKMLEEKNKKWGKRFKWGYKPLFPVEQQDMENLTYKDNFFDIVHCVNGLDHCANPIAAIKEMYRVCKVGGWIYLRHFPDNAIIQSYHGFHQWNLTPNPKVGSTDCIIWNRENRFLLSKVIPGFKTEVRQELDNEPNYMIISKLQKC